MTDKVILCVDDERSILDGLQAQLHREFGKNYLIEVAESAEEALDLINEFVLDGTDLPILVTDQIMPGIKGHELLIKVHKLLPGTLKILLTGQADILAISEAVNHAGLYRYIQKPWDGQDLKLTVKEALRSYHKDREIETKNRLLERHNSDLEQLVKERTVELMAEKKKSDSMLLNILPEIIATEIKNNGEVKPRHYERATVLFTDFSGFTELAAKATPREIVETLNECFTAFDEIIDKHNLEKIKTIGDAYMCAGGLPEPNQTNALDATQAACEILKWVGDWNKAREAEGLDTWQIRIGIHTGELVAGVIGKRKYAYDVWGDAVNIAARMESAGEVGKVNVSKQTYDLISDHFSSELRGLIPVKGKGDIEMFFITQA